jgi:putative ABC transport system ATP-binding protein
MNNTIINSKGTEFKVIIDNNEHDLRTIWKKNDSYLSDFRNKKLSFIFQQTNLVKSLNAFENVYIVQVLQGTEIEKAKFKAKILLKKMFDDQLVKEIIEGKAIEKFSGGQKQRLSFLRAISGEYKILLADEPTGNLDPLTADILMQIIRNKILDENKTSIIVTHDINLAIKYATKIVAIQKKYYDEKKEKPFGFIKEDSIFTKSEEDYFVCQNEKFHKNEMNKVLYKYLI